MMWWLIAALAMVVLAANVVAMVLVVRSDGLSRQQVRLQIALAWLLPLLGAVTVISFHWHELRPPEPSDPADDHVVRYIPNDFSSPDR